MSKKVCKFKFEMGAVVKDTVTGFTGEIVGRAEYATGCKHYAILPKKLDKDGKIYEWDWLDETRLALEEKAKVIKRKPTGGPCKNNPPEM